MRQWRGGYDSQASLDGVGQQEASWCVDLVVLLLNVLCNLLQNLKEQRNHNFKYISRGCTSVKGHQGHV